jgi:hypothetical protein
MTLSDQTKGHLLDAESHVRSAIRTAAMNEKPLVVQQLSKLLWDMEQLKDFDHLLDVMDGIQDKYKRGS